MHMPMQVLKICSFEDEAASTNGLREKGLGVLLKRCWKARSGTPVLQGPGWLPKDSSTSRISEVGDAATRYCRYCLSRDVSLYFSQILAARQAHLWPSRVIQPALARVGVFGPRMVK